jgi:hypothetical protein
MARQALIVGIVIVAIALIGSGIIAWNSMSSKQPSASPSPTATPAASLTPTLSPTAEASPTPEILTREQIRDAAMTHIQANHSETAQLMTNLSWAGGKQDTGLLGSVVYLFNSTGWSIKIQNPVVPNPIYDISADYSVGSVSVAWRGTYHSGVVTETSYNASNLTAPIPTQEQVRDDVMNFIKTTHTETAQYIQNFTWTGGRATPEGLVGSETYIYLTQTWNVTMQYPVAPNPLYTLAVNCTVPGARDNEFKTAVTWQGTWQNGTIIETSYNFTP